MRKNCETCKHNDEDSLFDLPCKECEHTSDAPTMWKPAKHYIQTNADRIRALSDEELCRWLLQFVIDCAEKTTGEECEFEDGSEAVLQEWLKQPAKGE